MGSAGPVLVVEDDDPTRFRRLLESREYEVAVADDLRTPLDDAEEFDCVVCGRLGGHTVAELVSVLDRQSAPVVYVYDEPDGATTALNAGAAATIPRREPTEEWGAHLAGTVDGLRRRRTDEGDDAPLLTSALDELLDIFFVVSVEGDFLRWNRKLVETSGYGDEEISEMQPTDFFEGADVRAIENAIGRVVIDGRATEVADLVTKDGRTIPHEFTGSLIEAGDTQAIVGTGRDIRERLERERELQARTERLEAVNRVNAVIRDVVGALLSAKTRESMVQSVCEQLAADDTYRFAWIGSYDAGSGELDPDAWAGTGEEFLQSLPFGDAADDAVTPLTAVRRREVAFVGDVENDPEAAAWRGSALKHGLRSAVSIPLVYNDAVYGCLCLYDQEPDAFGPLEREVLSELGEIIGHAIHAAETRRALAGDTVTALQIRLTDEESFLVQAADLAEAELELVGSTTAPDGDVVQLFEVSGIAPDLVRQFAEVAPMPVEVVTERQGECVVKVVLEEYSIAHVVAEVGGTVRTISTADGEARMRIDVPQDADVETVLERLREVYDLELLSRRAVERDIRSDAAFRTDVERHLTDRQLEVLETAYRAGFFDWPREQSGEEVADVLEVSPPTFHQHLRVGERKLLDVLFDQGPPDEERLGAMTTDGADLEAVAEAVGSDLSETADADEAATADGSGEDGDPADSGSDD